MVVHCRSGFTLIELSIVLVILGLIVGGVLVGRDLIANAALQRTLGDISSYESAVHGFMLKFDALPGDATEEQVGGFEGVPSSRYGDGNGSIGLGNGLLANFEYTYAWEHLSKAGLVKGGYGGLLDSAVCRSISCPQTALNNGTAFWIGSQREWWELLDFLAAGQFQPLDSPLLQSDNIGLSFVSATSIFLPTFLHGSHRNLLSPAQAHGIDSKVDDGTAGTGRVLTTTHADFSPAVPAGECVDEDGEYNLLGNHSDCFTTYIFR